MSRTSSPEAHRVLALEYARTDQHKQRVAQSVAIIQRALRDATSPYIAFSGGKDSVVLLALVERITGGVTAHWTDDELEYPETIAMMEALSDQLLFVTTLGTHEHAGWFTPWTDAPYWRDPLPGAVRKTMPADDYMATLGHDLTFTGIRAEESRKRRDWLTFARGQFDVPGLYPVNSGTGMRCTPLIDWTVDDVWGYTYAHDLPVNAVYARLSEIGVEPRRQRMGPLPLARRADLEAGWPEMLTALEARYGRRWS